MKDEVVCIFAIVYISTASKKERIGFPANKSNMCEGRSDGGNGEPCSGNLGL